MAEYTNAEKADMILVYGATDCKGRAPQRLYAERHPVRWTPAHTMFARLHQQLCETGSFQKAAHNRDRTARTELNEGNCTRYGRDHSQFKYTVSLMKSGFHTVAFGGFSMIVPCIHFTTSASIH
ncbi:DUF4817 domain-containing protein [Trichonephila clavipes]|nr:DUF4817 domain-containing protein [Trichonephila clavipes]